MASVSGSDELDQLVPTESPVLADTNWLTMLFSWQKRWCLSAFTVLMCSMSTVDETQRDTECKAESVRQQLRRQRERELQCRAVAATRCVGLAYKFNFEPRAVNCDMESVFCSRPPEQTSNKSYRETAGYSQFGS
ncbi:hypothetical protein EYF80_016740 [Liparis tanakae]|uniref:Uncharacterized protein n=1 Tax=Liparis tanakae TaxID=230148 RepID=A0A4Z2I5G9_9TELE|nr:hypothetical protein EYF80_016740 [Liparis tanakae]